MSRFEPLPPSSKPELRDVIHAKSIPLLGRRLPPFELLESELAYWEGVRGPAKHDGAAAKLATADFYCTIISSAIAPYATLEHDEPDQVTNWLLQTAAFIAGSRLHRELFGDWRAFYQTFYSSEEADSKQILFNGTKLYVEDTALLACMDVMPPANNDYQWLKGRSVYAYTQRPVSPEPEFIQSFLNTYGQEFDGSRYTVVGAVLKSSVWCEGQSLPSEI